MLKSTVVFSTELAEVFTQYIFSRFTHDLLVA